MNLKKYVNEMLENGYTAEEIKATINEVTEEEAAKNRDKEKIEEFIEEATDKLHAAAMLANNNQNEDDIDALFNPDNIRSIFDIGMDLIQNNPFEEIFFKMVDKAFEPKKVTIGEKVTDKSKDNPADIIERHLKKLLG